MFNADNPDGLAFVALVDIPMGEQISFTDNGWISSTNFLFTTGRFRSGEGVLTWEATTDIAAGTVIEIEDSVADIGTVIGGTALALSSSGDQIFAFTGSFDDPTLLFGINFQSSSWQTGSPGASDSNEPSDEDLPAFARVAIAEVDNAIFDGIKSGTRQQLLEAIVDPDSWSGDNSNRFDKPADFTVIGGTPVSSPSASPTMSSAPSPETIQVRLSSGCYEFLSLLMSMESALLLSTNTSVNIFPPSPLGSACCR